jgi:site-specific DNA-methyltransferase (adenine-specific)
MERNDYQLILGNCLEVMREYPDNAFDLCLTDPPYGIGEAAGKNKSRGKLAVSKDFGNLSWDDAIPSREYFDEIRRISKNQIIFGGNYFVEYLSNSSCWLVWDKDNGMSDFADCELAWTSFKSAVRYYRYRWNGMLQEDMKNKETRVHPTQKPLSLMRWCLENYSKPGDSVIDPFMGSGTTLRACKDMGRPSVGIDITPEYIEIAKQRLGQEVLF